MTFNLLKLYLINGFVKPISMFTSKKIQTQKVKVSKKY